MLSMSKKNEAVSFVMALGLELELDNTCGLVNSIRYKGREVIKDGIKLNLWRAPTDNDGIKQWKGDTSRPIWEWLAAGYDNLSFAGVTSRFTKGETISHPVFYLELITKVTLNPGHKYKAVSRAVSGEKKEFEWRQHLKLGRNGKLLYSMSTNLPASLPDMPRFGVCFRLAKGYENIEYVGNGPNENYSDRKSGSFFGRYHTTVSNMYQNYVVPQEHGCRTGVKKVVFSGKSSCDSSKNGELALVRFSSYSEPFSFTASHFDCWHLTDCAHINELEKSRVFVCLDYAQSGLGTRSCGPRTRDEYLLFPGMYSLAFNMEFLQKVS
mmetsp:Transcript_14918/g.21779  ORF Transcript_14918/g.21779 Transcript_14918/m.21779 type:complete len:324 (-) Transcript_14918:1270-2241(-)